MKITTKYKNENRTHSGITPLTFENFIVYHLFDENPRFITNPNIPFDFTLSFPISSIIMDMLLRTHEKRK